MKTIPPPSRSDHRHLSNLNKGKLGSLQAHIIDHDESILATGVNQAQNLDHVPLDLSFAGEFFEIDAEIPPAELRFHGGLETFPLERARRSASSVPASKSWLAAINVEQKPHLGFGTGILTTQRDSQVTKLGQIDLFIDLAEVEETHFITGLPVHGVLAGADITVLGTTADDL